MPPRKPALGWFEDEMLRRLSEVNAKVDASLTQGADNGEGIRLLRKELGVDGDHGRIPQIEQSLAKLEIRIETLQKCVDLMEDSNHFAQGRQWVVTAIITLLCSSGGIALFEYFFRVHGH